MTLAGVLVRQIGVNDILLIKLQEICLLTIQQSSKEVFESDDFLKASDDIMDKILRCDALSVSEMEVYRACMAWAAAKCQRKETGESTEALKVALGDLLYLIRFPVMPMVCCE